MLALLEALALKVDALSTRLDEHDNNKNKKQRDIPSDNDEVGEGGKDPEHDARTAAATGRARGVTAVLWRPRNDEADRYLTEANKTASRDEYRHMLCYGVYRAAANAAAKTAMAAPDTPTQDRVDALDLLDAAHRTLGAVGDADAAKLTYLRRYKAKKALTPRSKSPSDSSTLESSTPLSMSAPPSTASWRGSRASASRFNQGVSFNDATPTQFKFLTAELRRFTAAGVWEKSLCAWWAVSRAFFVTKPGDNQWRFIIDLRVLNTLCARKRLRMETLTGVRHLAAKGDYVILIDLQNGFYAVGIAPSDRDYFTRASRDARWLPVRELQSLAGRAQYLFLAIPAARFYLRELHDVVGSKWAGRVRMTHQLRRDLQWWTAVPTQSTGRPIHRHVETAYVHCDSSGYGWGAVLNGRLEARGLWGAADERRHITWKELKAARLAVESFLPLLAGRQVLLHEDNQAVCNVLAGLTSRSPEMMAELRKLLYLLDNNGVHIKARYIRSAANVWADRLRRHLDSDDWQQDPVLFAELKAMWGAATAAYAIGVVLQKIKHFGGWAEFSSVLLDYINPTALPCEASWRLFGWLTLIGVGRRRQAARPWAA
eukprot:jgi/Tetstr1/449857/TSEL_036919.t1